METWKECAECRRRFEPQRRANRFYRTDGPPHEGARYCSNACKQAAYRRRCAISAATNDKAAA